jgi:hypothetical protein
MVVIEALRYHTSTSLSSKIVAVLTYLRDTFPAARFVDPANTNNVISDDLAQAERNKIASSARFALMRTWGEFVS